MMNFRIVAPKNISHQAVALPASKSVSNRALILNALTNYKSRLTNLSKANDTAVLQRMLKQRERVLNAEDAGSVLRFAAVYFSLIKGEHVITGTDRLMQRPMQPLLDALERLGGKAIWKKINGKNVLMIQGGSLRGGDVVVDASESSQFVSALLLCGAAMPLGLKLTLKGKVVSEPYIDMTLGLMEHVGLNFTRAKRTVEVPHQAVDPFRLRVESDWSSASYVYSAVALSKPKTELTLKGLSLDSLQGDALIATLMKTFDVQSKQVESDVMIRKVKTQLPDHVEIDATDVPDLVPALAATAIGSGVSVAFKGIAHLRFKESDRVNALIEIALRFGADAKATKTVLTIVPPRDLPEDVFVNTYNDHRIAMAFAPLALRCNSVTVGNRDVVKKSYPGYWKAMTKLGFQLTANVKL